MIVKGVWYRLLDAQAFPSIPHYVQLLEWDHNGVWTAQYSQVIALQTSAAFIIRLTPWLSVLNWSLAPLTAAEREQMPGGA